MTVSGYNENLYRREHMHILATNDDGIYHQSLMAMVTELRKIGRVTVVAPDHNWSASGHQKTLRRPLRVKEISMPDGSIGYACDGSPADCVSLPAMGLFDDPVDLVVSGINPNANLGHDVTYSGTVTAAMEAVIWKLPALAVSVDAPEYHRGPLDFSVSAEIAAHITGIVWEKKLPNNTLLNVNVPYCDMADIKGYRITRHGMRVYRDELIRREDPRGVPYYWIGGEAPTGISEEGTDFGALSAGYVSITPLTLDMTNYEFAREMRDWVFG
jgi:5'-nucleotidase